MAAGTTGLPSTNGQALAATVGFPYASFFLGQVDRLSVAPPEDVRLGRHDLAGYVQDSWKVTRKLTLDYGLRYDFSTYQREQYGRMPSYSTSTLNPAFGNVLGTPIFEGYGEGRCNCQFAHNYPHAWGPRLGLAWQSLPKTVLRAGLGVVYASTAPNNRGTGSAATSLILPSGSAGF